MTEQQHHILRMCIVFPLLPLLILQGRGVRRSVPRLPEAIEPHGAVDGGFERTVRVLGIGESTMAGVGVEKHADGFIGAFARRLSDELSVNVDWTVHAKNGIQVRKVKRRLLDNIPEQEIDIIVVALGANDAFNLRSPKQFEQDMRQLIEDMNERFPNVPIVFTNMPPIHHFPAFPRFMRWVMSGIVDSFGRILSQIVKDHFNVYCNDERIEFEIWRDRYQVDADVSTLFSDGVHPSKLTYQLWGQDMAQFVQRSSVLSF